MAGASDRNLQAVAAGAAQQVGEVPFGDGFLDLKKIVTVLREKDPNMYFDLETITRDPLKIPIYTDKYWATTLIPDPKARITAKFSADQAGTLKRYQTDYFGAEL